ncbi:helix-turn-helix domain-containing protein [Streptomyces sp. NPDC127066]|uniref:helix-turn-helix domain-containing protein n=1 Tax=Streptomyces sp. NPDC127066 TaxID=3347125 RepID=UPI00365809B9
MEPLPPPTELSVKQVARQMQTHPSTVYRWITSGKLKAVRSQRPCACGAGVRSGTIRIPAAALESFQPPALDD